MLLLLLLLLLLLMLLLQELFLLLKLGLGELLGQGLLHGVALAGIHGAGGRHDGNHFLVLQLLLQHPLDAGAETRRQSPALARSTDKLLEGAVQIGHRTRHARSTYHLLLMLLLLLLLLLIKLLQLLRRVDSMDGGRLQVVEIDGSDVGYGSVALMWKGAVQLLLLLLLVVQLLLMQLLLLLQLNLLL